MVSFGNTTVLPSPSSAKYRVDNKIMGGKFQMGGSSGTGVSIVAYINGLGATFRAAIYDNALNKLAECNEVAVNTATDSWVTFNFSTIPSLTANAYYYIFIWGYSPEAAYLTYNTAGGGGVDYKNETYGSALSWPTPISIGYRGGYTENPCIYCIYTVTVTPSTPRDTYASGYLTRYQKRQIVGYHRDSGDLRSIEVNASGQLLTDVEVEVSSGLHVIVDGVSGTHVYVESGVYVIADVDVVVSSGLWIDGVSGIHVYAESGVNVITQPGIQVSGIVFVQNAPDTYLSLMSGQFVIIQDGIQVSGAVIISGDISISSGLFIDGVSGIHVYTESGAFVTTQPGIQVSGSVIISGDISVSSGLYGKMEIACADTIRTGTLTPITAASGGCEVVPTSWCSGDIHSLIIKNLSGNADIFIGGTTCKPYSGYGFCLAGEEAITLDICQGYNAYGCANTSGQFLTYIGTDY